MTTNQIPRPYNRWLKHIPLALRYLLILSTITGISFLFPRDITFKYAFEKGKSWNYEDLIAPFDFPILKTQGELEVEIASLEAEFPPCYVQNPDISNRQLREFDQLFSTQLTRWQGEGQFDDVARNPDVYASYGRQFLARIFDRGVVAVEKSHQNKGKDFVVQVFKGNKKQNQTLEYLYSASDAKEEIIDSLPFSSLAEPEFLLPILEFLIVENVFYDDTLTTRLKEQLLSGVTTSRGMVSKGEPIVYRGSPVSEEVYQKLVSFRAQYKIQVSEGNSLWGVFAGYLLLGTLVIGVFTVYLQKDASQIFHQFKSLLFVFSLLILFSYLSYLVQQSSGEWSPYLIPFAIVPILIRIFFNARVAFFSHIVIVLLASLIARQGYEFIVIQFIAGAVVMLTNLDTRVWSRFFFGILSIFFAYMLGFVGLSLIQEGSFEAIKWEVLGWIGLNVFLTLLAYPLTPMLEKLFGFTSYITLLELSDMNRPLLQRLTAEAPGTLQHSLQVGNLAEAAARKIGADHLLVKVAALYHDIGKLKNPSYFIENQGIENSRHRNLEPLESARIIIEHVTYGVELARKNRLPRKVVDFIKTHHGTTLVMYFFRMYKEQFPGQEFDESLFRYPGPKPQSREESILMLADSIEAAAKSLKDPTEEELMQLVDKIVEGKISQGQLKESRLSFADLNGSVLEFKKMMKSIYHLRIKYPEDKNVENKETKKEP